MTFLQCIFSSTSMQHLNAEFHNDFIYVYFCQGYSDFLRYFNSYRHDSEDLKVSLKQVPKCHKMWLFKNILIVSSSKHAAKWFSWIPCALTNGAPALLFKLRKMERNTVKPCKFKHTRKRTSLNGGYFFWTEWHNGKAF